MKDMNPMVQQDARPLTDPLGGLASVLNPGYGSTMAAPTEAGATVAPEVEEAVVTGRPARKMSLLGKLADGFIAMGGGKPVFRGIHEKKQLIDDMEGFADDPLGAIKRIAARDPATAYKMYQSYVDDQRADSALARQNGALDMRQNEYLMDRVGGMLNTATPENYGRLKPMIEKYIAARGLKMPFDLPAEYDEDAITAIRMGEVPVAKQIKMNDDRAYRSERLEDIDLNRDATNDRFYTGQANQDRRQVYGQDRQDARQGRGIAAANARSGKGGARSAQIRDSKGNIRDVLFSPDGTKAKSVVNGQTIRYHVINGKLIPVKD